MEIVLENITVNNKKEQLFNITTTIKPSLTGIYGKGYSLFIDLLLGKIPITKGTMVFKNDQVEEYYPVIKCLDFKKTPTFNAINMKEEAKKVNILRVEKALKLVGLSSEFLTLPFYKMALSNKKKCMLALTLLSKFDVLILNGIIDSFDYRNKKFLLQLFKRLKERENKIIIFATDDVNFIYTQLDNVLIFKNNKLILDGKTDDIFTQVRLFKENELDIPELVKFTDKVRSNKKIKLGFHKDVRDLIKDIYKRVDFK